MLSGRSPTDVTWEGMGLQRVERRLEGMIEGAFARAFGGQLRPVEIGRRLVRAMDLDVDLGVRGEKVAPNDFEVELAAADLERFADLAELLPAELAAALEEHAADERYTLKGPVAVTLVEGNRRPGTIGVRGQIRAGRRATVPSAWIIGADGARVALRADDPITVGRLPECDIVTTDPNVSRRHAEIRCVHGEVRVVDLGSLNGTQVNGRGVPSGEDGAAVADGDRITVGSMSLRVVIGDGTRSGDPRSRSAH
jgi:hypothetical protein